ncbi:DUF512 domain-containing protein [Clostridium fungisolvens]|uniref:PDZ domain-containing protein n=1 Tax=Clostridium fungisolvens TaxID=1604897 RepID=A0A6V8SK83_9CLOT|nr:DUF512 domain-containing protein [Clostridium fungisolvens]GFP75313.1 hypothetical protein bsdtw1_01387 [Clostridium fungisolvens]
MKNKIAKILPGGIAEELGIEVGDYLISINETEVNDVIDYKFLMAEEYLDVEVEKPDGEVWVYEIEKEYDEDLGVEFEASIMDKAISCSNKCIFCFIDQLPTGMRDTLYFKDDDSRLSFLQGNFVTLTNMKDCDIDRIIRYRISPINVSVHTTNPDLRVKMLNNRFAGNVYDRLKRLAEAGIEMNAQIVVVPGVNNGEELQRTVLDLYKLHPSIQNIAAVPIGITKHREGLAKLDIFDGDSARKEIELVEKLQEKFMKEIGSPFVRLSDEFYVLSNYDIPDEDFYDGYHQIEDGVGVIRMLRNTIERDISELKDDIKGHFAIATGVSAYDEVKKVADSIMNKNNNIKIDVYKVINHFFGETITVNGLLTGKDIINQLKENLEAPYLIMADNMFRKGYELGDSKDKIMLDDLKIKDVEEQLDVKVIVCDYTGEDLIQIINTYCEEE